MTPDNSKTEQPDPKTYEGFIARAYEEGGLKRAVKEAERLFQPYSNKDVLAAAGSMSSKVRNAVTKMVTSRKP